MQSDDQDGSILGGRKAARHRATGYEIAWLDLREPADVIARDQGLLLVTAAWLKFREGLLLDLGCGTGATWRAMSPLLGARHWRLLDHDANLLNAAAKRVGGSGETVLADMTDILSLPLQAVSLVTASALLDLVTEPWIESLAERLCHARIGFYAALTYDGTVRWTAPHPLDAAILQAFNTHQRRDKGSGPALGPLAGKRAAQVFTAVGYGVRIAPSPWRLGPDQGVLQSQLIAGMAEAAAEIGVSRTSAAAWRSARQALTETTACVVGHIDLLAVPA